MSIPRLARLGRLSLFLTPLLIAAFPGRAQPWEWPERPSNVTVLAETVSASELRTIMQEFVRDLGVQCEHCHVGRHGQPRDEWDFVSDARPTKETARQMMRLVEQINRSWPRESGRGDRPQVTCWTCHRGTARPMTLHDDLADAYRRGGASAVETRYRDLRERFFGSATYDFRPAALVAYGRSLLLGGRAWDALAVFRLSLEFHPGDADTHAALGDAYAAMDNPERAREHWIRALTIDPDQPDARRAMDALEGR